MAVYKNYCVMCGTQYTEDGKCPNCKVFPTTLEELGEETVQKELPMMLKRSLKRAFK